QGLQGLRAPARRSDARPLHHRSGGAVSGCPATPPCRTDEPRRTVTETTPDTTDNLEAVTDESAPSSFTTESTGESAVGAGQSAIAPGYGTGRRKRAIARVRLTPGSGQWVINGRTIENYFPNKLHQQEVNDPFT